MMDLKIFLCVMSLGIALSGRSNAQEPKPPAQAAPPQAAAGQQPLADDDLAQMRADLNRLESLHNLMSSEIEFLHDQNLQILLRTNAQMWTVLTRDLRRLIEREEQRRASGPVPSVPAHPRSADESGARPAAKPPR